MKELVLDIAKALVDNPDAVVVEETRKNDEIILKLTVSQDDMGKVIGKQGRIAKAIRTVVRSAANREKVIRYMPNPFCIYSKYIIIANKFNNIIMKESHKDF